MRGRQRGVQRLYKQVGWWWLLLVMLVWTASLWQGMGRCVQWGHKPLYGEGVLYTTWSGAVAGWVRVLLSYGLILFVGVWLGHFMERLYPHIGVGAFSVLLGCLLGMSTVVGGEYDPLAPSLSLALSAWWGAIMVRGREAPHWRDRAFRIGLLMALSGLVYGYAWLLVGIPLLWMGFYRVLRFDTLLAYLWGVGLPVGGIFLWGWLAGDTALWEGIIPWEGWNLQEWREYVEYLGSFHGVFGILLLLLYGVGILCSVWNPFNRSALHHRTEVLSRLIMLLWLLCGLFYPLPNGIGIWLGVGIGASLGLFILRFGEGWWGTVVRWGVMVGSIFCYWV